MNLRVLAALAAGALLMGAAPADDPYVFMEEIEGARALAFARAENDRSLPQLKNDRRFEADYAEALKINTATDRIPAVGFAGAGGMLRNFWQDAQHVRGIWRETTSESYRSGSPLWRTILDLDVAYVNGGRRGFLVGLTPAALISALHATLVEVSDAGAAPDA